MLFFGALFNRVLIIFTVIASWFMAYFFPELVRSRLNQQIDVSDGALAWAYLAFHIMQMIVLLAVVLVIKKASNR